MIVSIYYIIHVVIAGIEDGGPEQWKPVTVWGGVDAFRICDFF